MLKEKRKAFEYLFMAADLVVVTLSWLLAYWIRFNTDFVEKDKGIPEFTNYLSVVVVIWVIWAFVYRRIGLYRPMRGFRGAKELILLLNANSLALLTFIAFTFLVLEKSVPYSRLVFVYFGFFVIFGSIVERSALRAFLRELRRRGYNVRYMLIVGAGKVASDIAIRVRMHSEMGFQLVGCLAKEVFSKEQSASIHTGVHIVGAYKELHSIVSTRDIDQVMIALPLEDNHLLQGILEELRNSTVDVKIIPDIYQFISVGGSIEDFEGLPIISLQESPLDGMNRLLKRCLDIVVSLTALFILSPVMLVLAILVRLSGYGSILYKQERMSFDGSKFSIYKFRTMKSDAEQNGPGWTKKGDNRVTPIGSILRKWSLDELPQLWNVLKGDMSIVGPRPERPVFIEEFRRQIPSYMLRHKVPAGITGWAQINGWRGDTSIDKRIEYDLYYIRNWSLFFDIKILFLTLFRGFRDRNAY